MADFIDIVIDNLREGFKSVEKLFDFLTQWRMIKW